MSLPTLLTILAQSDRGLASSVILLIVVAVIIVLLILFTYFIPVGLWITAFFSGVRVNLFTLVGMRLRKVSPPAIIRPLIAATKAGLALKINDLESHYLAGGNVGLVVNALISADKANIELGWKRATAIDLAGRNVLEAVQVSVNPKVITTPKVAAMAKDGIQLIATARVTVRANIDRLVGGAGEETILARVGEGIVSTIGSAVNHKAVLENPDDISKTVLARKYDPVTPTVIEQMRDAGFKTADVVDVSWDSGTLLVTLRADPTHTADDALKDIYHRLRPGDPATVSNAPIIPITVPNKPTIGALLMTVFTQLNLCSKSESTSRWKRSVTRCLTLA